MWRVTSVYIALVCTGSVDPTVMAQTLDPQMAGRFAVLALDCVRREYPNKISHVLHGDSDARPPRELTPAFFGCYDWHSSVHAHWLLARLTRLVGHTDFADEARQALNRSLTAENIADEVRYLSGDERITFERPYGLAWLLQLAAELREWEYVDVDAARWRAALEPIEALAAHRLKHWLPNLSYPIRTGEHSQSAFAFAFAERRETFGLVLDWARTAGDVEMQELLESRIDDYYREDRECPLGYEPSGQDFLSPCLAEADLMRRVQKPSAFAVWLKTFLPGIPVGTRGGVLGVSQRPRLRQRRPHPRVLVFGKVPQEWADTPRGPKILRGLAAAGCRDGPDRREDCPPGWPQPEPSVDA